MRGPLFDLRYCEILVTTNGETEVWTSRGLHECPQAWWDSLDADTIKDDRGADSVILNGPRHYVCDQITNNNPPQNPQVEDFYGEDMKLGATATIDHSPYVVNDVDKDVMITYVAGAKVYGLMDSGGVIYICKSRMDGQDMSTLHSRIDPPQGWSFMETTVGVPLSVQSGGVVVMDEFDNSYDMKG